MKSAARTAGTKSSLPVRQQDFKRLQQDIHAFFDYANLSQAKASLWNWLSATVTGSFNKELDRQERSNIIELYERLLQLLESLHQFHQPHLNKNG